jgi:hypothetical protein
VFESRQLNACSVGRMVDGWCYGISATGYRAVGLEKRSSRSGMGWLAGQQMAGDFGSDARGLGSGLTPR